MVHELRREWEGLHERQQEIIRIFGRISHAKYEVSHPSPFPLPRPNHPSSLDNSMHPSSFLSNSKHPSSFLSNSSLPTTSKGEVFIDVRWKPLVLAHKELEQSFSRLPMTKPQSKSAPAPASLTSPSPTSAPITSPSAPTASSSPSPSPSTFSSSSLLFISPSIPAISSPIPPSTSAISLPLPLPLPPTFPRSASTSSFSTSSSRSSIFEPAMKKREKTGPRKKKGAVDSDTIFRTSPSPTSASNENFIRNWSKRVLCSATAKYLLSEKKKSFGRLRRKWKSGHTDIINNNNINMEEANKTYEAVIAAIDPAQGRTKQFKGKSPTLFKIANSIPINEWESHRPLKHSRKYTRVRRFLSNRPSFFSADTTRRIVGWTGYTRAEVRKAVTALTALSPLFISSPSPPSGSPSLKRGEYAGLVYLDEGEREGEGERGRISRRMASINLNHYTESTLLQSRPKSRKEARMREVISSLDEKLRDLKNKYAEEMRRSMHIQSELMKAESEKLDLVEHFSRLLEEKEIELGFLQKSARGEENREAGDSYYGNVAAPHPPNTLPKDFFKKGIFDNNAPPPVPTKNTSEGEPPLSARSASSAAELSRFEAALEQILPGTDSDPIASELDKELFEQFMHEEDYRNTTPRGYTSSTPPNHTPTLTPIISTDHTPREVIHDENDSDFDEFAEFAEHDTINGTDGHKYNAQERDKLNRDVTPRADANKQNKIIEKGIEEYNGLMEMDLQQLMNMVNDKYDESGYSSDQDPADAIVDIERLKVQYGFDD